eukprot:scaffold10711_cov73-Cyclotella_meneghiniana.AAC.4
MTMMKKALELPSVVLFAFLICMTTSSSSSTISRKAAQPNTLRSLQSPQKMQQSRRLENYNNDDNNQQVNGYNFDLSQYSIKFEKCQTTKLFDSSNENSDSVLKTKRFVIFRLCPDSDCSNYGEYLVDLDSYLETTIEHMAEAQEQYCEECNSCVGVDDDVNCGGVDVDTCYSKCQNIANMESNGYVDAADYTACGKVYYNQNTGVSYYAGAMCSSSGTKIKIGLFDDNTCSTLADVDSIDHYIKNENGYNVKLSYHLLKQTFGGDFVASCYDEDGAVSGMCQTLYEDAGKCEYVHGFSGIDNDNYKYATQIANEEQVCEFISKLKAGHYDQSGEIVLTGRKSYVMSSADLSDSQIFALTFFVVGTVGLTLYAVYLRRKIKFSRANLASL